MQNRGKTPSSSSTKDQPQVSQRKTLSEKDETEETAPPEIRKVFQRYIYKRFGFKGLLVIVVVGLFVAFWWNWSEIKERPGISQFVERFMRQPVPKANPAHYSVMVASIESDEHAEHQQLIVEALKEFDGIEVLSLDRTIPLKGSYANELVKVGHSKAREYLLQSGAQVLIWGTVLRHGSKSMPKLYWTLLSDTAPNKKPGRYNPTEELGLPALFWTDFIEVLSLLVATQSAEYFSARSQYVAENLLPFIERVRNLVASIESQTGWSTDTKGTVLFTLASALNVYGEQSGQNAPLEEAISYFRMASQEWERDRVPLAWAATQVGIGTALTRLGEREYNVTRLEEGVEKFRMALQERTRERVPLEWAQTLHNLGSALATIGQREQGTERLKKAGEVLRMALLERTVDRVPLEWASTQNNLGTVLLSIGDREYNLTLIEEALEHFRAALQARTCERVPLDWAMTQENIGNALSILGERGYRPEALENAVKAFRAALLERTRERLPIDWAMTQYNLGATLFMLNAQKNDIKYLCQALQHHLAAWDLFASVEHFNTDLAAYAVKRDHTELVLSSYKNVDAKQCLTERKEQISAFYADTR